MCVTCLNPTCIPILFPKKFNLQPQQTLVFQPCSSSTNLRYLKYCEIAIAPDGRGSWNERAPSRVGQIHKSGASTGWQGHPESCCSSPNVCKEGPGLTATVEAQCASRIEFSHCCRCCKTEMFLDAFHHPSPSGRLTSTYDAYFYLRYWTCCKLTQVVTELGPACVLG
jgi:hypothetical protein